MKKIFFASFMLLFVFYSVFAADVTWDDYDEEDLFKEKKPLRIPDRFLEYGIIVNGGLSNNFFTFSEVLKKEIVLDMDNLANGFIFNLDFNVAPVHLMMKNKDKWGFGIFADVDFEGVLALSGDMLTLKETVDSKSEFNGSAFLQAGIDTFFSIGNFKVKLKPAVYYPLIYLRTDVSYKFSNVEKGTILNMGYDMRLYTPFPVNDFTSLPESFMPTAFPGFDLNLGLDYALSRAMGFSNRLLTFDIGLDFINIPIYKSTVRNYMEMTANFGFDDPIDITDGNFDELFSSFNFSEPSYGAEPLPLSRPFGLQLRLDWRPLGTKLITIRPMIGFSKNTNFLDPFYMNAGVTGIFDLANLFIFTVGFNYIDRVWKNSFGFAFNCRLFQLDVGIDLRSQDFVRSWNASGLGFNVGLKFGW